MCVRVWHMIACMTVFMLRAATSVSLQGLGDVGCKQLIRAEAQNTMISFHTSLLQSPGIKWLHSASLQRKTKNDDNSHCLACLCAYFWHLIADILHLFIFFFTLFTAAGRDIFRSELPLPGTTNPVHGCFIRTEY